MTKYLQLEAPDNEAVVGFISRGLSVTLTVRTRKNGTKVLIVDGQAAIGDQNSSEFREIYAAFDLPEYAWTEDPAEEAEAEEEYEAITGMYEPKMTRLLHEIGTAMHVAGWCFNSTVIIRTDAEIELSILLRQPQPFGEDEDDSAQDDDIDITFTICKQSEHEAGGRTGIAFRLSATTVGGEIIGDMTPHNWSDDVWVDMFDVATVAARFDLFDSNNSIADSVVAICASRLKPAALKS